MKIKVMAVSPPNKLSGSKELRKFSEIAVVNSADLVLLPSSYLPYYLNSSAFLLTKT